MKTQPELIHELAQLQHEAESITRLMHDLSDHLARILDAKSILRHELEQVGHGEVIPESGNYDTGRFPVG